MLYYLQHFCVGAKIGWDNHMVVRTTIPNLLGLAEIGSPLLKVYVKKRQKSMNENIMVDDPLIFCLRPVIGNKTSSGRYIERLLTEVKSIKF